MSKIKDLKILQPIIEATVTNGDRQKQVFISRITEATILTIDNDISESKWNRKTGRSRSDNSWHFIDLSLSFIEHVIASRDPEIIGTHDSGFRTRTNSRGEIVHQFPPLKGNRADWLRSLGFRIVKAC